MQDGELQRSNANARTHVGHVHGYSMARAARGDGSIYGHRRREYLCGDHYRLHNNVEQMRDKARLEPATHVSQSTGRVLKSK